MKNKPVCYHPFIRPTDWNQPKPEPCEMTTCACGKNVTCPVCGWGHGQYPCDCEVKQVANKLLDEYSELWKGLAEK